MLFSAVDSKTGNLFENLQVLVPEGRATFGLGMQTLESWNMDLGCVMPVFLVSSV